MAPTLFEKINTLISANLHGIVDKALQANSVQVMDEYIRQVESNLGDLEESTATVGGTVKTLKRKYEEFAATAEKLDRDIDTLIVKGKDDLAAAAQAELNTKQQLSQEYYQQWHEHDQHEKQCAALKRSFVTSGNSLVGLLEPALKGAQSQSDLMDPSLLGSLESDS